ncbi:Cytochrome c oxidase caa3 assembly factor [Corynebacterium occultum]|uniref:Cytochrome c oxidase caa3 assembly factor n=1 Tax=Corynebacterium occultum TaxID=2675219 RepID=A0A6B8VTB2_9CORY|nr:cytochrome c oxidase assembly protein [Corynebacterium occultum]QGU07383.1 Cytochrome c oxidase caa3 assembly factor [Corynebacterium occultum]
MRTHHEHVSSVPHGQGWVVWVVFESLALFLLFIASAGYALALYVSRERSPWPFRRTVLWYAGVVCAGFALVGPVAEAAHSSFTFHMVGHLLLGMVAPLLLVLAGPVSLVLRALPVSAARRVSGFLRTPGVRVFTHPVIVGLLNAGGLWLLYTTDLFHLMHSSVLIYVLVHLHIFLAGYIFTASLVGVDPDPHRASMRTRSVVLVFFIAAHQILAKWLYAYPPAGIAVRDGEVGAQLMYYGGDVVDVALIVLLFLGWYRVTRPRGGELVRKGNLAGSG